MTVGAYHAFSQPIYTHNGPTYKQLLQFQFGKPAMASGMAKKTLNYLDPMRMHAEIKTRYALT